MLERIKPNSIPEIHPLPEFLVEKRTKEFYEDTKEILQVPWMGVVTMAYAHYPEFYETLWKAVRPIMASQETVVACNRLRWEVENEVKKFDPPKRAHTLNEMGYAPREVENIKQTLEVFSHGNYLYALIATLARLALEQEVFPNKKEATEHIKPHSPQTEVPFVLMEEHHADEETKAIYSSVREKLGLPFVNTDYRALARWPTYFRLVWNDIENIVTTPEYEATLNSIHNKFVMEAMNLPNPTGASAQEIKDAADKAAPDAELLSVCQLFQWLLPGLMTNVAFFRFQLQ